MSRDMLIVGSTMRIPLLYRGEYSQSIERFMNYLEEQTDGEAMINSIKNDDQPLPRVTQVSISRTSSTEQPPLKDKSMWSDQEKMIQKINRLKKKAIVVTSNPLALIAEKTEVSKRKEKVVVSSNSEGSNADDFSELKKITALLSANKKQEFVKSNDKKVEKKDDEKKRDMSKVKCYNCKKEGHFAKYCKKVKVKDYKYYKTKMLLAKKDKDEQVLLAEDQAWMESGSDSDQEINANMVFMAKIEKVLSDSEASLTSGNDKIYENDDFLAQTKVLKDELQVKHVVIDTHIECQEKYAKPEAERYEYMIRYSAYFDNDKQHKKQIADQEVLYMSVQLIELDKHVIAPKMFKLSVSQSVSPLSVSKTSCASKNVENKTKRKRHKIKSSKQYDRHVNNDASRANSDFVHFLDLDTFSSVRRPKHSGVIWKKKGSSNTFNIDLSSASHSNLNKDVKRYSRKDLSSCNNSHLGETSSVYVCNDAMNTSCNSRLYDSFDENNLFIFDDESVRISPVSKMPFRKKPRDSMNVLSKSNSNKSLFRNVHKWLPKMQPLAEPVVKWIPKIAQICLWIIDSCCSKHMMGNRALLTNFVEKFLRTVRFGNNDFAMIDSYGDAFSSQSWLWHQRLLHLNFTTINNLVKNNLVQSLPKMKFEKDHLYSACEQGKIHQKHHKSKTAFVSNKPLYLLHIDLCGSMHVESVNGKRYVLVVVDDYSWYTWIMKSSTTNVKISINDKVFHEVSESFQAESTSSSLNDDVQQSPEELILPQTSTQSNSNNMIPSVDEANHVYALDKALYGLKQAPWAWYDVLSQFLIDSSFQKVPTLMVEQAKLKLDLVEKPADHTDYQSIIGSLTYVTLSRPDIMFATCDKLVCWSSKKQNCVSISKAESEYVAVSSCCAQVLWMRTQLTDYGFFYDKVPIYGDSKNAIAISCNPVQHTHTKHIDVRYYFIKDHVEKGTIELYFVGTEYQLADLFTKSLPEA
nr:Gag-Pol polyprotein [Tanacetum cinerariifolium]